MTRSNTIGAVLLFAVWTVGAAACAEQLTTEEAADVLQESATADTAEVTLGNGCACSLRDHCRFVGVYSPGACEQIPTCMRGTIPGRCEGNELASESDHRHCLAAQEYYDPRQTCQIWASVFHCRWVDAQVGCVPYSSAPAGNEAGSCSWDEHCSFFGWFPGACDAVSVCQFSSGTGRCEGNELASESDQRQCLAAQEQYDPRQACQIWATTFHCRWVEGQGACVPRMP